MRDQDETVFIALFNAAVEKCFGHSPLAPLSEVDSKHFSTTILEKTGLVIGPKSLRNYSIYVLGDNGGRKENPSVATLDTLARYVAGAPRTDEASRKEKEPHFPFWYQYKTSAGSVAQSDTPVAKRRSYGMMWRIAIAVCVALLLYVITSSLLTNETATYSENFSSTNIDSMKASGWRMNSEYVAAGNNEMPGHLKLLTLPGDNWGGENEGIKSMLWREVSSECFTTEIHISDFFPEKNWQQVGLILSEDASFKRKAIRLGISYNSFFGGYARDPEIVIQAVSSTESGEKSKPEEIAHLSIFSVTPETAQLVRQNLQRAALKIERTGNKIRFLYAIGEMESFAFREVVAGDFNITTKYVAIYASQGLASGAAIPVYIDSFTISEVACVE